MAMRKISKGMTFFALTAVGFVLFGCMTIGGRRGETRFTVVENRDGPTLSVNDQSILIKVDDLSFKDLNRNGTLDPYEDWRLTPEERAKDLVSRLTIEQIAPLMLASMHFRDISGNLNTSRNMSGSTNKELLDKGMRTFLNADGPAPTTPQVLWNNALQAVAEADVGMLGIPVNIMSDPRSNAGAADGVYDGSTSAVSKWPGSLGFAATFNPEYVGQFARMASVEYRALGITTALSPQIDVNTEPRWLRASGTYGESPLFVADASAAYVKGFQTSPYNNGWGTESVAAMLKHWPGDGPGEAGRESHTNSGKFAVHPGNNLAAHLVPFAQALNPRDANNTSYAASIMPSYSIGLNANGTPLGGDPSPLGSGVSPFKLRQLLYGTFSFSGYVCTDWGVAGIFIDTPGGGFVEAGGGTAWGTQHLEGGYRIWAGLGQGVDMYGGLESVNVVKDAYRVAVAELGQAAATAHFEDSAYRILLSFFRLGLFENPYRSLGESLAIVGNAEFNKAGYEAQLQSIVMLKNSGDILSGPSSGRQTVYIPMKYIPPSQGMFGDPIPARIVPALDLESARRFYNVVTDELRRGANPANYAASDIIRRTDFAGVDKFLLKVGSPQTPGGMFTGTGYSAGVRNVPGDVEMRGLLGLTQYAFRPDQPVDNGYFPVTLQYREYYADPAVVRARPIGIDAEEDMRWVAAGGRSGMSRYYGGKSTVATNEYELDFIMEIAAAAKGIPVVLVVSMQNPMIFSEFESIVDAIVISFGTSDAAILEVVSGGHEPNGLLPLQMPLNMAAVERQLEDVPFDMTCYVDSAGNVYDFGFGLNWTGAINDGRKARYDSTAVAAFMRGVRGYSFW